MADFRNRVLPILDRIYGFLSADHSISRVQLNQPVQLVHDVSREAELGSGQGTNGGFFTIQSWGVNHAGAGTLRNSSDPYQNILTFFPGDFDAGITRNQIDLWLIDYQVYSDSATEPNSFYVGVAYDGSEGGSTNYPTALFEASGGINGFSNYASTGDAYLLATESGDPIRYAKLPYLFLHSARVTVRSIATGACNPFVHAILWCGKRGTAPPGMR